MLSLLGLHILDLHTIENDGLIKFIHKSYTLKLHGYSQS